MERDALAQLIERMDEDLVLSADTPRDDFLVSVYTGKEIGFFDDTSAPTGRSGRWPGR